MTTKIITESNKKLWLAAIKPPMYTVAVIPIIVGTALAFELTQSFYVDRFLTFLGAGILIIAWLNLSNDVFDSETGIDKNKAHSVVNLTGNKNLVFWISNGFLLGGILGIIALVWWQQDLTVLGIVLVCCALGYTYQGPPFRFGYLGLGEIICFICFGPGAISAAYYAQTQSFSLLTIPAGVIIGITTSIILFCSHFHQVEDDIAGEPNTTNVTGEKLAQEIALNKDFEQKPPQVFYQPQLSNLTKFLPEILTPGDLALFLGAGNLNHIIPEVINLLAE